MIYIWIKSYSYSDDTSNTGSITINGGIINIIGEIIDITVLNNYNNVILDYNIKICVWIYTI